MTINYNHTSFPTQQLIYPPAAVSTLIGLPLAGARVFTYKASDHTTPKTTYESNMGSPPPALPNPVVANAIGQVTIYWALDDNDVTNTGLYYVRILGPDGDDTLYYEYDNFDGASLIGQIAPGDTIDFNLVRNPQFTFNRFKPYPATYILTNEDNMGVDDGIYIADDWKFTKSNTSTIENISITPFTAGQAQVTYNPVNYLSWNIDTAGSGETYKKIFQEYKSVQTLSGQTVTFQFWATSSGNSTITIDFRQYFGTGGGASADVVSPIITKVLTNAWAQYSATIAIPPILGKSIGTSGTDKLMFEINFPLNATAAANVDITNIQIEFGSVANEFQYETPNDQRTRLDQDWFGVPTGDIKFTGLYNQDPPGWIVMQDEKIGNATSGAYWAREDGYALYAVLWNNFADPQCPVSTGRGANALADFNAGKTINLPLTGCRLFGNTGAAVGLTARVPGVTGGAETSAALIAHTHSTLTPGLQFAESQPGLGSFATYAGGGATRSFQTAGSEVGQATTASTGSGASFPIMNPFVFIPVVIKL